MSLCFLLGIDLIAAECDLPVGGEAKTQWWKVCGFYTGRVSLFETRQRCRECVWDSTGGTRPPCGQWALCFSRSCRHRLPSVTWWHNFPSLWNGAVKNGWSITSESLIQILDSAGKHSRLCRAPRSDCLWWRVQARSSCQYSQTTAALTCLKPIWKDKNIGLGLKLRSQFRCHLNFSLCLWIMDTHIRDLCRTAFSVLLLQKKEVILLPPLTIMFCPTSNHKSPQVQNTGKRIGWFFSTSNFCQCFSVMVFFRLLSHWIK